MKTIIHRPNNTRKQHAYIQKLRKKGMTVEFGRYIFDADALFNTRYECDPLHCLRELDGRHFGSCCTDYIVYLEPVEIRKINRILERGRKFFEPRYPQAYSGRLFKREKKGPGYLRHGKNNTCPLSVVKHNRILCVIDIIAKKYGLSRKEFKPSTCYSWPFECVREGDRIFVTAINRKNGKALSQATGKLKCVSGRVGEIAVISLKEQLKEYLGAKTFIKLINKYNERLDGVKKNRA